MSSDYNDICMDTGFTANDDAESNSMSAWIDKTLVTEVMEDLLEYHNIALEYDEIIDIMEQEGINFGYERDMSVADLIWDSFLTEEELKQKES